MAARVNTRFILIFSVTAVVVVGAIGALAYLQIRGNAERHFRKAEALLAAGELDEAIGSYGRAASKDPANRTYLKAMEAALLQTRPETQELARKRFGERATILQQITRYHPGDAQAHLDLLAFLHDNARQQDALSRRAGPWTLLEEAADQMLQSLPESDPQRVEGLLYRGIARTRLLTWRTMEEAEAGTEDLRAYLEAHPASDLGWASLLRADLELAAQYDVRGRLSGSTEQWQRTEATCEAALQAVPDGPAVAVATALYREALRRREAAGAPDQEWNDAIAAALEAVRDHDDPTLIIEIVRIAAPHNGTEGQQQARALLSDYLERHPDALYHKLVLAELHMQADEPERAVALADEVMNAEPIPLQFMSRHQFLLRKMAASVRTDVAFQRWLNAGSDEQREAALAAMEQSMEAVREFTANAPDDSVMLRADGLLAFAKGQYNLAASKLDAALDAGRRDFAVYYTLTRALDEIGVIGRARATAEAGLERFPDNRELRYHQARLLSREGRHDKALEIAKRLHEQAPGTPALSQLIATIQTAKGELPAESDDAIGSALLHAQSLMTEGRFDEARTAVESLLQEHPGEPRAVRALAIIEMQSGNREAALAQLDRLVELGYSPESVERLRIPLSVSDPVEQAQRLAALGAPDEATRAVRALQRLTAVARSREAVAARLESQGDAVAAAEQHAIAERARSAADDAAAALQDIDSDHPQLLEYRFGSALAREDWDAAAQLAARAQALDLDQAGGALYRGRLELARGRWRPAAQALEDAVARKDFSSTAWYGLATAYQNLGDMSGAQRCFAEAYQCDRTDLRVVLDYVNLLQRVGEHSRALTVLREADRAAGDNRLVREQLLTLEAQVGDVRHALVERRQRYETHPDDRANAVALARMLVRLQPRRDLMLDADGTPRYSGREWAAMDLRQQGQVRRQAQQVWRAEAWGIIEDLKARLGVDAGLVVLEADFLARTGQLEAAAAAVQSFAENAASDEQRVQALLGLALIQREHGRAQHAVATLREALPLQNPEIRPIDRALGELYVERQQYEQALPHLEAVADLTGSDTETMRIIECLVKLRRIDEAQQRLDEAIDDVETDFTATMLQAAILRERARAAREAGDTNEAEFAFQSHMAMLDRAGELNPGSPMPHVQRALTLVDEHTRRNQDALLDEALRALDRAEVVQADDPQVAQVRVRVLLAKGDLRGATSELAGAVERDPTNAALRQTLLRLHLQQRNVDGAIRVARDALDAAPNQPQWLDVLGDMYANIKGDMQAAAESYLRAYQLTGSPDVFTKYVAVAAQMPGADLTVGIQEIESRPEDLEAQPLLRALYAQLLDQTGQRARAIEQLRRSYRRQREMVQSYETPAAFTETWYDIARAVLADENPAEAEQLLRSWAGDGLRPADLRGIARLWLRRGSAGLSRAGELIHEALEQCPADDAAMRATLYHDRGDMHLMAGAYADAVEAYEQALEADPDREQTLNNMAFVLAAHLGRADEALPHAERARELAPENGAILDTLGWVLYHLKEYDRAEAALRESFMRAPGAATLIHLSHVVRDAGRPDEALEHLTRAEALHPTAAETEQINELVDEIRAARDGEP